MRPFGLLCTLALCNVAIWLVTFAAFAHRPALLGVALLAYVFGLRHAIDADHIAAIDGATRTLMQQGRRPLTAGLFFSLGHSTVVLALSAVVAFAASSMSARVFAFARSGGALGSAISAAFLLAIAVANVVVLARIVAAMRRPRIGPQVMTAATLDDVGAGTIARVLRPMLRLIGSARQMYPVGLLFGLGFDTATEVAVLGISAIEAARGLPIATILLFPLLFAAGMTLADTSDGLLMIGAYGWAMQAPRRRQYYNIGMTLVSALVALGIGCVEALGALQGAFGLRGWVWDRATELSANFGAIGMVIVGAFAAAWAVCVFFARRERLDGPEPSAVS